MAEVTSGRILVVDDKYYIRQLLMTALGLKGYEVVVAANGQEGLEMAARTRPEVILLDLLMPGLDGYAMVERLRQDPATARIPVIIMSAKADMEGIPPVPGADDYLVKPFDLDVMEALVARHVTAASHHHQTEAEVAASEDTAP